MRNLATPSTGAGARRGSSAGIGFPLASPNQARYKGIISTPGITKFSAWKRDTDVPKIYFHEFILKKIAEKPKDRVWIKDVSNGRFELFGNVNGAVKKISSGLSKLGFGKGDVLCMFCSNYVEYWLIALAAWSCGGCVMPVNCELEPEHLEYQLSQSKAKVIVCDELNVGDAIDTMEAVDSLKNVIVIGKPEMEVKDCIAIGDLLEDDGKSAPKTQKPDADWEKQTIFLPFSSTAGSTLASSRGIEHTHKSLISSLFSPDGAANHWFDQVTGESVACGNWFFHMSGLYSFALAAIYGLTLVTQSDYTDNGFLEAIVENKVNTATMYSWQIRMLSQSPEVGRFDLSCLKIILSAGSILSPTIRMEAMERVPSLRYIREAYGLNECGIVTLSYPKEKKNSVSGGIKHIDLPDDHIMPVGLPNMYSQIKIINRQTSEPVQGPDEQGEICIKSPQCFKGYLNQDNSQIFDSDGFFHTGDLGYYDSQGVVFFIECIAHLIQFWMYEVAPSILESRLLSSNNIVDAAVVGITDKENGQVPRAFVVLRPGFEETEENVTNLMESRLGDHERIRGGLYFIQSIPRDENWKVRRDVLAEFEPKKAEDCELNVSAALPDQQQPSLAQQVAESPKLAKKLVTELERLPNGSFVAAPQTEVSVESTSPRTKRAVKPKENADEKSLENTLTPAHRRGSMDCILEDTVASSSGQPATASARVSGRRGSRIPSGSRGNSRRGSSTDLQDTAAVAASLIDSVDSTSGGIADKANMFSYWLQVSVSPQVLEKVILTNPAVQDVVVQGFNVEGVGQIPRAYVTVKSGYMVSADDLVQYANSKVALTDRLLGGVVFVENLYKDPGGRLFMNLEKYDTTAQGIDDYFLNNQPKVKQLED